ncbi:IS5 family transposase [Rhizobium leguminosarum]|uniref:IS5 family transposase n=1 Tax=Rhizobium leguminosarum TaxID=384 RepID=UPI001031F478|nr:IS5 family transposase [Rhizobium leguminosarum]TAU52491.1 IS5 family transposase [Rhizobium leguminosarum]
MSRQQFDLTDFECCIIQSLLPNKPRGVPRVDDRRVINGILWRFRTGSPWADVPERYGPYTTCYNRFVRWRKAGVWDHVMHEVAKAFDGDIVMIDSSCVRVHQHAANGKKGDQDDGCMGRSRGGLTTKIHALVDADGRPIGLDLTAGQTHDSRMAEPMLKDIGKGAIILADRAYDTNALRALAKEKRAWANIPAKRNRKETFPFSGWVYRQRNLVKRFFNKLKQFRGIATRYDKNPRNFLAAIKLAATRIWIRSL